jgi:crotonobetaine/carnitine-CoA ligase
VVIARRFSASRFWDDIRRYGCTHFNLFGTMPQMLLAQPPHDNDRDHHVEDATVAGMPPEVWEAFTTRFGVRVCVPFSAIDSGGMWIGNPGKYPIGSCGRPWIDFEARLVDDDDADVPEGESGELIMRPRGGLPLVRYYNDPEASAEKTRGGWSRFGDLMRRDEEGNYWFVDRKRDVIRRRGIIIAPAQIEGVVSEFPGVLEVSAFAVPSELGEDEVKIAVVPREGASITPQEIALAGYESLPKHMRPRYVELVESLPKTPTARVKRIELKANWRTATTWDSVEEAYLEVTA